MALQVWLPLNGDLNNKGLSGVAITNGGTTVDNNGKLGKCYSFGTSTSYLSIPPEAMTSFTTEASICFWINILSWNTTWATYFQAGTNGTAWSCYRFGFLRNSSGSNCAFVLGNGSSTTTTSYTTPTLELNKWYHVALIYKTGYCAIYINGNLHNEYAPTIVPAFAGITHITIGMANNKSSYQTNCLLNDFRIYDHCLSSKEVNEISKGLVLHYKLAESDKLNANLVTESEARVTSNGTASTNEYAAVCNTLPIFDTYGLVPYTLSFDIKAAVAHSFSLYGTSGSNPKYTFTQKSINVTTEWQRISYTFTPTLSAENGTWARISVYGVYGSGAIVSLRNVKLELGEIETPFGVDTGIIADVSGYKHNGTVTGNLKLSSNSPRYKSSLYFDGSSYIKTLPGELSWSNFEQLTIAAWMKPTVTPSNYTGSIGIGHDSSNGHKLFAISNYAGKFYLNMTNGSYVNINSGYTCPLNEWHHYAVTLNGVTLNMYVDGVVVKTTTIDFGTAAIHSNPQFQVGVDLPGTDEKYTGYYSDVRIYATALSAEDINDLYHTSAFVDDGQNIETFEFDEVTSDSPNITKSGIFMAQTFTEDTSAEIYAAEVKANQLIEI